MAHNPIRVSVLALTAACIAQGPAAAQGNQGSAYQQLQGVQQQSDKAQRNPSLEGAKSQSGQGIDTKGSYAPPVRAPRGASNDGWRSFQVTSAWARMRGSAYEGLMRSGHRIHPPSL